MQNELIQILRSNPVFQTLASFADEIQLKNWYVAGGCVTQTVWNSKLGLNPAHGIKDIDLVYFDKSESEADQEKNQLRINQILSSLKIPVDVKNEALVHKWYFEKFGYEILPYESTEDGIRTWLSAFAIGVRPNQKGFEIFAPYGLDDLFAMVIRPNKIQITEKIYLGMAQKFKARWPETKVMPW